MTEIIIILIAIIILIITIFFNNTNEYFTNETIKMYDWTNTPKIIEIFLYLFNDITNYTNIEIHTVLTQPTNKNKNTLYVQYVSEANSSNETLYDINFNMDNNSKNNILFPYGALHMYYTNMDKTVFLTKRNINDVVHNNFCLFSVSNPNCNKRNDFFNKLQKYKHINSCGKLFNNMKCPTDFTSSEYNDIIKTHKFMICFENETVPNYFTEKLIIAYYYNTIPIYWGCPNIDNYVNIDSILYLRPNYSEEEENDIIKQIIYLDNNPDEYKKKYESIFFKNEQLPDEFNTEKIKEKINNVLNSI